MNNFGALWGVFGTFLGALMALGTLLARRLTLEPSTTPDGRRNLMGGLRDFWDVLSFGEGCLLEFLGQATCGCIPKCIDCNFRTS